ASEKKRGPSRGRTAWYLPGQGLLLRRRRLLPGGSFFGDLKLAQNHIAENQRRVGVVRRVGTKQFEDKAEAAVGGLHGTGREVDLVRLAADGRRSVVDSGARIGNGQRVGFIAVLAGNGEAEVGNESGVRLG